ncbi:hypothetical protein THRCLA_23137 [Thraustotheca clavata]|uniref:Uncharacterized protein n=1 Tax=Thraustotheca clavata TaxID=74557 RepID=A0A1V9YD93_9STRA|nr:hypothetical protein THRCLA_23137 [Thraustotheca clavata]
MIQSLKTCKRKRRQSTPEQMESSRRRAKMYYIQHKAKVLAKVKERYDENRKILQQRRRQLYLKKYYLQLYEPSCIAHRLSIHCSDSETDFQNVDYIYRYFFGVHVITSPLLLYSVVLLLRE